MALYALFYKMIIIAVGMNLILRTHWSVYKLCHILSLKMSKNVGHYANHLP
jgi:hypothetical protein